nr:DNA polymerase V subunit UmuC [Salmonella sp. NCTC 7297]
MFALCDVNPFYASCETVFRPDLRGRPVVVLSNNDGCVIARSADYVEKVKAVKRGWFAECRGMTFSGRRYKGSYLTLSSYDRTHNRLSHRDLCYSVEKHN